MARAADYKVAGMISVVSTIVGLYVVYNLGNLNGRIH
jgi:hypothetical protein